MSHSPAATAQRHPSLRREIVAILAFKLVALIGLYFLFFDERPDITPTRVEERVLESGVPLERSAPETARHD